MSCFFSMLMTHNLICSHFFLYYRYRSQKFLQINAGLNKSYSFAIGIMENRGEFFYY